MSTSTKGQATVSSEGGRVATALFDHCDFLLGKNGVIVVVVPVKLPDGPLFLYVEKTYLSFAVGDKVIADVRYVDVDGEIFRRLNEGNKAGIVEYPPGEKVPNEITAVAMVRHGSPPRPRR